MNSARLVYDAEYELEFLLKEGGTVEMYGSTFKVDRERVFGSIESAARFIQQVCEHLEISNPPAVAAASRARKTAKYSVPEHTIFVPDHDGLNFSWALRELTLLHELAHALVPQDDHGPVWAGKLLWLLEEVHSPEAAFILLAGYSRRDVQVKKNLVS